MVSRVARSLLAGVALCALGGAASAQAESAAPASVDIVIELPPAAEAVITPADRGDSDRRWADAPAASAQTGKDLIDLDRTAAPAAKDAAAVEAPAAIEARPAEAPPAATQEANQTRE